MSEKDFPAGFDLTDLTFDEHPELVGFAEDELLAVVGGTVSGDVTNAEPCTNLSC